MDTLRFDDLLRLAAAQDEAREAAVKEIATKYHERCMAWAKGFGGAAATIVTTIVIPWFVHPESIAGFDISWYCAIFLLFCSLVFAFLAVEYAKRYVWILRATEKLSTLKYQLRALGY
jgi:type II secretory pathway component PulL